MKRYRVVVATFEQGTRYIYVSAKNKQAAESAAMLTSELTWNDVTRMRVEIMKKDEVL